MALDENLLGEKIYEALTSTDPSNTKQICFNLAKEILDHIKIFGVINTTVTTNTGSGVGLGKIS